MTNIERGLTNSQIAAARQQFGRNELQLQRTSAWSIVWRQVNNPLLFILFVTTVVSYFFNDHVDAAIITLIIAVTVLLGFFNEYSSERTVSDLLKRVSLSAVVIRNGEKQDIPVTEVVVGDVVLLHQGSVVPADMDLLQVQDITLNEASLTGESMPAHKQLGTTDASHHTAFMGTVVVSGTGIGVVTAIAGMTEFGKISQTVTKTRERTDFQKGLHSLTNLITRIIGVMAVLVGALNILMGRNVLESVLFALSIAIGLTPELLPVIVTVTMARGAHRMAKQNVLVKQLVSIEDLGNMEVLCTDKTGTLTEGKINLLDSNNAKNNPDFYVLQAAMLCNTASVHHRVIGNPIDVAIWEHARVHHTHPLEFKKIAEEEFNYDVRGQYAVAEHAHQRVLFFKGAPDPVLDRCTTMRDEHGKAVPLGAQKEAIRRHFHQLNEDGLRLVAVAQKTVTTKNTYSFEDANELELLGYLTFLDTPKTSAKHAIDSLCKLGVSVKIITGDNELVTKKVADTIGFAITGIVTGPEFAKASFHEREKMVMEANIFARVSPEQKLQVIQALKKAGKVVGFMGDGVNDAAALHAADVGISVNTAVDVAKDTANIVLLRKGLDVIADGIKEGRGIFANTIKYILMGTSSNFGNMFSVAGASFIFKSFLPLTPSQILLNNLLYDVSQLGIPTDSNDPEALEQPSRWNMRLIYRYMLFFGPISSVFDYLSFGILWFGFHASGGSFQTGWFLESIATQILVVFVIRTSRSPFWKSLPSTTLMFSCALILLLSFTIPFSPVAKYLDFATLPSSYFLALAGLVVSYLAIVEFVKARFLRHIALGSQRKLPEAKI